MFFKQKEILLAAAKGVWFPSGLLFSSLLLHGLLAYFLMTWNFSYAPESLTQVVVVRIVEEKKEKAPVPPLPSPPKPKKIQKTAPPEPAPLPGGPSKEEALPSPSILETAEHKIPQILPIDEEKIGVEEKPREEWMEKAEPLPLAKEEPAMSLTTDSGSAPKGIPGGLVALNPWGKGAGGEVGYPGGVEGGKGTVPPKGSKTGSVYFQGEGIGRGDLGSYLGNARMKIEKAKRYPREARRRGWEGKVVLSFQINRKGEVGQIRLIQTSGYQELDEEGIATIRRASPFLPPPLTDEARLEVQIPLVFRLEQGR